MSDFQISLKPPDKSAFIEVIMNHKSIFELYTNI